MVKTNMYAWNLTCTCKYAWNAVNGFDMGIKMGRFIYDILIVVIGILLFAAGIIDIKKRLINRRFLLLLLLVCLATAPLKKNFGIWDTLGGLSVGLCAIGVSMISRGQIGKGDGYVIAAVGIVLGLRRCLAVVSIALLMMCMVAMIILALKKGNRHTKLPFLPAVFVGYMVCMMCILL